MFTRLVILTVRFCDVGVLINVSELAYSLVILTAGIGGRRQNIFTSYLCLSYWSYIRNLDMVLDF